MKQFQENGWFAARELPNFLKAFWEKRGEIWPLHSNLKYFGIYVDSRTGDFLIKDRRGDLVPLEKIMEVFPSLQAAPLPTPTDEGTIITP